MKTTFAKRNWVIPVLGTMLVAGTLLVAKNYCCLEQQTHDAEALSDTLARLYQDQQLVMVLKRMHDGDVNEASRRLDLLLCNNIVRTDAELSLTDPRTRGFIEDALRKMALTRPKTADGANTASTRDDNDSRAAAEKILSRFLTSPQTAQVTPRGSN